MTAEADLHVPAGTNAEILTANRDLLDIFARTHGLAGWQDLQTFPRFLTIETIAACNARCGFCPILELERDVKMMDDDVFEKIATDIGTYADHIKQVNLYGVGEPFLDKRLPQRIERIRRAGVARIYMASNGSLATPKRARAVLEAGLAEIAFSIDGTDAKTHEAIRPGLRYSDIIANVEEFIRERDRLEAPCSITVRMVVTEHNRDQYDEFLANWRRQLTRPADRVYGKFAHSWANQLTDKEQVHRRNEQLNRRPCTSPWGTMVILSDGRVALCCLDYNAIEALGDVRTHTLREVWDGPRARAVRNAHLCSGRSTMKMCINCDVWESEARLPSEVAPAAQP